MKPRKSTVRLLSIASDDLAEIVTYIGAKNVVAAAKLADKIEARLAQLANYPLLGKIPAEEELARLGYRYLVIDNYLVFYTLTQRTVLIHRIIHGARDYLNIL